MTDLVVKFKHIREAVKLIESDKPIIIDGRVYIYDQSTCCWPTRNETLACVWGIACALAGVNNYGYLPRPAWALQSERHARLRYAMAALCSDVALPNIKRILAEVKDED